MLPPAAAAKPPAAGKGETRGISLQGTRSSQAPEDEDPVIAGTDRAGITGADPGS